MSAGGTNREPRTACGLRRLAYDSGAVLDPDLDDLARQDGPVILPSA
jgi:hypothetical protein